jgi:serine/threonine protein kinase
VLIALFYRVTTQMKREASIHYNLRHANIVTMLGKILEDPHYGLVLEFVEYGSLDTFLKGVENGLH